MKRRIICFKTIKIANYLLLFSLVVLSINWITPKKNSPSLKNITSSITKTSTKNVNNLSTLSNFSFSISLDHPEYLEAQEVWIKIEIKNNGKTIDSLLAFDEIDMLQKLIIKDPNGVVLKYHGLTGTTLGTSYVQFKSNETKIIETELIHSYANISENLPENKTAFSYGNYFANGIYSIELKYIGSSESQTLLSNHIELKVIEPLGEEKSALNELRDIYRMSDNTNEDMLIKIQKYDAFVDKYPNSKYMDQAFAMSIMTRCLTGVDYNINFRDKMLRYIQNRPNTYQAAHSIWYLIDATSKFDNDKSKPIEILEQLQRDYAGTKVSIAAANKLQDEIKKKENKK